MTDDLIARARAHADLHPESASVIGELLDAVEFKQRFVGSIDGGELASWRHWINPPSTDH